jgi:hypothetical protein
MCRTIITSYLTARFIDYFLQACSWLRSFLMTLLFALGIIREWRESRGRTCIHWKSSSYSAWIFVVLFPIQSINAISRFFTLPRRRKFVVWRSLRHAIHFAPRVLFILSFKCNEFRLIAYFLFIICYRIPQRWLIYSPYSFLFRIFIF